MRKKPDGEKRNRIVTIKMRPDEYEKIKKTAWNKHITISDLIRAAINLFMKGESR